MKKIIVNFLLVFLTTTIYAVTPEQYIEKATNVFLTDSLRAEQCLDLALEILNTAIEEYPENADILAHLGIYTGQKAGEVESFQEKASLAYQSFAFLDNAVSIDAENVNARYYRGIMGVSVPDFMGKLEQGTEDFEVILSIYNKNPGKVSQDILLNSHIYLNEIYEKTEDFSCLIRICKSIIENFPDTEEAIEAKKTIEKLENEETETETENIETNYDLEEILSISTEYIENKELEKAEKILLSGDINFPENFMINKLLGIVYALKSEVEYNEEINKDTDYRTNLCFKTLKYFDRAIEINPNDIETRLLRGKMGVGFPFFVDKLDQSMEDLTFVLDNTDEDSIKAECLFFLGQAYQKKAVIPWIRIAKDFPESDFAQQVFQLEKPQNENNDFAEYDNPIVIIDFSLGFKDELAPQTAVWIEDESGDFVKTVFVSGFAGFVGNVQITLPKWGNSSDFQTDGTTGASIDIGNHQYIWDLKGSEGQIVENGVYTIKVETWHWPSMFYQIVKGEINIGDENTEIIIEEGNFIPYFKIRYQD